jgi:hypothetical protein
MSPHPQPVAKSWPSPIAKWHAHTRPAGQHLLWTGPVARGLPVLDWRRHRYMAVRIAYTLRTGHPPTGPVHATCGKTLCVHPRHVSDTVERRRDRALLALLRPGDGAA